MPGEVRSQSSGRLSSLFGRKTGTDMTPESLSPGRRSLVSFKPVVQLLSTSMLAAPRFPKAPPSPQLREGYDYTPLLSEKRSPPLRRLNVLASTVVPGRSFQAVFAVSAISCGFAGGMLLAWWLGLL